MKGVLSWVQIPAMNGHHVPIDLRTTIECLDALGAFVLERTLVPVTMKFESSSILERFVTSVTGQGIQVKE